MKRVLWHPKLWALVMGTALLGAHYTYLTHLDPNSWRRLFTTVKTNTDFIETLELAKHFMLVAWACLWIAAMSAYRRGCERKGLHVEQAMLRRLYMAGAAFCIFTTAYRAPDSEFAPFLFGNSIAYLCIAYALTGVPRGIYARVGLCVSRLMHLPALYVAGCTGIVITLLSYGLSGTLFSHLPFIDDTIAQYVHAKFMAAGAWAGAPPALPQFFPMKMMAVHADKWFSQYPPGHLFFLAIGQALGHPESIGPILGGLTGIAIFLLARDIYGAYVARIAAVLSCGCVYLLVVSAGYMNHSTALLMATLFVWGYFRMLRDGTLSSALLAGAALGYCYITRPYTAFFMALPFAVHGLYLLRRGRAKPLLALSSTVLVFAAFQLYYNAQTTGDALLYGYEQVQGRWHNPFSQVALSLWSWDMQRVNILLNLQRLNQFNRMLFEWPVPALVLALLTLAIRGNRREERLLLAAIVSVLIGCQLLPGNVDRGWGPRLAYELTGLWVVLCAKGLSLLPALARRASSVPLRRNSCYGYGVCLLACFYAFSAAHALRPDTLMNVYQLYNREGDVPYYQSLVRQAQLPALIFVPPDKYSTVAFTNPPLQDNSIIFAVASGVKNIALVRLYPGRYVYKAHNGRLMPCPPGCSIPKDAGTFP